MSELFTLSVGDYYNSEQLSIEHKEFTLNKSRYEYPKIRTLQFLKDLQWNQDIETLIHKNIHQYLSLYVTKYLACYTNVDINGELNFGIDDYGIIRGIPLQGTIQKQELKQKLGTIAINIIMVVMAVQVL